MPGLNLRTPQMTEEAAVAETPTPDRADTHSSVSIPLNMISSPGAYVCDWSGHLLRIPRSSLPLDGSQPLNIIGGKPLTVTKISDNCDLPLAEARGLAWRLGLSVGF